MRKRIVRYILVALITTIAVYTYRLIEINMHITVAPSKKLERINNILHTNLTGIELPAIILREYKSFTWDAKAIKLVINYIVFSDSMVKGLTEAELAFVLGHEYGHHALGHFTDHNHNNDIAQEMAADYYGHMVATLAGYDSCAGRDFMVKIYRRVGNGEGKTHPKTIKRIKYLSKLCGDPIK